MDRGEVIIFDLSNDSTFSFRHFSSRK